MVKYVKQGSRVVYAVGGVEYNAIALGAATFGVHPGLSAANFHLNLIYLSLQGEPVKVFGAPLLSAGATEAEFAQIVEAEVRVKPAIAEPEPDATKAEKADAEKDNADAHIARLKASPVTLGWRPYVENEEVFALKAQVAEKTALVAKLSAIIKQKPAPQPAQPETTIPVEGTIGDGKPSAADLDAHVEQQGAQG